MKNPGPLIGWILMIGAIAGTVVLGTLPAPYVLESPGPVYDTIGEIQQAGEDKPVISIEGEKTYDTSGTLDMLTVNLRGSRQTPLSWLEDLSFLLEAQREPAAYYAWGLSGYFG